MRTTLICCATVLCIAAQLPAQTQPSAEHATEPATSPASQPSQSRLAKFKVKFARTPQAALKAQTPAPADAKADEAAQFQADVVAGRWDAVAKAIASFEPDEAKQLYKHVVTELLSGGQQPGGGPPQGVPPEVAVQMARGGGGGGPGGAATYLMPEDVLALIEASPADIDDELLDPLGQLLGRAISKTNVVEPVVARLDKGIRNIGGSDAQSRTRAANLLIIANRPIEAGSFLPALGADLAAVDPKLLDLHSRHLAAAAMQPGGDKQPEALTKAWDVTRALVIHPRAAQKERDAALARALELLPRLSNPVATDWLNDGFTAHPEQGMAALVSAGNSVSQSYLSRDLEKRQRDLAQQKLLVDQLLSRVKGPGDVKRWSPALGAMASLWLQEVEYARNRPSMAQLMQNQRRVYYYGDQQPMPQMNPNEAPPVDPAKLLECAPSEAWLAALEPSLRGAVRAGIVQMYFKNDTPQDALPVIETLAASHPKLAGSLSNELLRSLARLWDVSSNPSRAINYVYSPTGMMMPVMMVTTRSAQVRNINELSNILQRLGKLSIDRPEPGAIVAAFAAAHSQAEVFRLEDVEKVFGPTTRSSAMVSSPSCRRCASDWRRAGGRPACSSRRRPSAPIRKSTPRSRAATSS